MEHGMRPNRVLLPKKSYNGRKHIRIAVIREGEQEHIEEIHEFRVSYIKDGSFAQPYRAIMKEVIEKVSSGNYRLEIEPAIYD